MKKLLLIIMLFPLTIICQETYTIHGIVGTKDKPLEGAKIIIKGTAKKAISDVYGDFKLTDVTENDSIEVSYTGLRVVSRKLPKSSKNITALITMSNDYDGGILFTGKDIVNEFSPTTIEKFPHFQGCKHKNKKICLQRKITTFFSENFNSELIDCVEKTKAYNFVKKRYELKCLELPKHRRKFIINFKIGSDGYIKGIKADTHPNIKREIERVLYSMPKIVPGKIGWRPVTVRYTLPVNLM